MERSHAPRTCHRLQTFFKHRLIAECFRAGDNIACDTPVPGNTLVAAKPGRAARNSTSSTPTTTTSRMRPDTRARPDPRARPDDRPRSDTRVRPDNGARPENRTRPGDRPRRDERVKSDTTVGPDTWARPGDGVSANPSYGNSNARRSSEDARGRETLSSSPCRPSNRSDRRKTPDSPRRHMMSWGSFLESNTTNPSGRRHERQQQEQPLSPGERDERGKKACNHLA